MKTLFRLLSMASFGAQYQHTVISQIRAGLVLTLKLVSCLGFIHAKPIFAQLQSLVVLATELLFKILTDRADLYQLSSALKISENLDCGKYYALRLFFS